MAETIKHIPTDPRSFEDPDGNVRFLPDKTEDMEWEVLTVRQVGEPEVTAVRALSRKKRPHYSRRGGRAYPEPSDSEIDPYWTGAI